MVYDALTFKTNYIFNLMLKYRAFHISTKEEWHILQVNRKVAYKEEKMVREYAYIYK